MKKIKTMMAMMLALVSMCVAFSACSSSSDDSKQADAAAIAGTYVGNLSCTVSTSTSTVENASFIIEKVDDSHVNVTLPAFGEAPMALPSIKVEKLSVTESNGTYSIPESTFDQTIKVNGNDKNISNTAIKATVKDGKLTINFSMKYGSMPFSMICSCENATKK